MATVVNESWKPVTSPRQQLITRATLRLPSLSPCRWGVH